MIAGRVSGFQRLYDLAERVIPKPLLDASEPDEATRLCELALRAVRARGVLTESAVVEHWRLRGGVARIRPTIDALVDDGRLERLSVEDGGAGVLVSAGAELDPPRPTAAVLLSPFDNLLWDRAFVRRVFGFDHVIEVYKRAHERAFGYYVLPLLWRDRIVGRADLKTERKEGTLVVKAFHSSPVFDAPPRWTTRSSARSTGSAHDRAGAGRAMTIVSVEEARRIAVRAQLLDGSATTILDTVRRLGFLQMDPISTVAPPQQLVLWSRLGPYDLAELDRLLWEEKKLFEWNAFIRPIEDLPLIQARMRRRRGTYAWERRGASSCARTPATSATSSASSSVAGRSCPASSTTTRSGPGSRTAGTALATRRSCWTSSTGAGPSRSWDVVTASGCGISRSAGIRRPRRSP